MKEKKKKVTSGEVGNILKVMAEKITSQETEKENLVSVIKSLQEDLSVISSHLKEGEEVYENTKDPEGSRKFLDESMEELATFRERYEASQREYNQFPQDQRAQQESKLDRREDRPRVDV